MKICKKACCILTVIIMIISSVSICASAIEQYRYSSFVIDTSQFSETVSAYHFDPLSEVSDSNSDKNNAGFGKFYSSQSNGFSFYSSLSSQQKDVYNTIKNDPFAMTYTVTLTTPITANLQVVNNQPQMTQELYDEYMNAAIGGYVSVVDDYPGFYWLASSHYVTDSVFGVSLKDTDMSNYDGSTIDVSILSLSVTIYLNTYAYTDMDNVRTVYNNMMDSVNSVKVYGYSRFEKVKSIHDYIINNVIYDPNLGMSGENPTDHEPTSVFLEPHTTVCEGYAEAFKILCDREGIPCVVVVGYSQVAEAGHAWNYVQMDDGNWYAIDSTWDDLASSGSGFYYFLVGSDSPSSGSDTFSALHTPTGIRVGSYALTYPTLSTTPYSKVVGRSNSTLAVDKTNNYIYLTSGNTATASLTAAYGYNLSSTGNITGSIVKITKTGASSNILEQDTLIIRGDVVINGVADSADYEKIAECASGASQPGSDVQFAAADLNHDGAVDAFDWFILDKMMNGYSEY